MTNLHAYFHLRNLGAFRQLLDGRNTSGSRASDARPGSGSRSWSQQAQAQITSSTQNCTTDNNPNSRDTSGRTVLHLACADVAPIALEFVRALLTLPSTQIDINAQDTESGWTALHRALYAGNLPAAILLLARSDIDTGIRDLEGMTSFDGYNATVEGTTPDISDSVSRDLLVWGSNRNATLGVGDANDRTHPEVIQILRPAEVVEKLTGSTRFSPIKIKHIAMSRLHTIVLTNEPRGNLEACGFGGVGRLGTRQHAQYDFSKIPGLESQTITAIALGLDHTLALTQTGDVFSWGMNRFHQLGYVIEPAEAPGKSLLKGKATSGDANENQVQLSPKRVLGPIRKEAVIGIAASKTASVCWTAQDLYTWGTNTGQLGYAKGPPGWQVLPRKVATVSKVIDVAISENAMVCLLSSKEVVGFWNESHFRIQFPTPVFPHRYRPPQALTRVEIAKITCNEAAFAALTISGEVFLFTPPDNPATKSDSSSNVVRPQRVWMLRRRVAAARDIALGADGTVIVCTVSGHVFVHAPRPVKGPSITSGARSGVGSSLAGAYRTHKFQRVPGLQRVVSVAANSTGGFAALRADSVIKPLVVERRSLAEDISEIQPYLAAIGENTCGVERTIEDDQGDEEDEETEGITGDIKLAERLCLVVAQADSNGGVSSTLAHHILHGADMHISGATHVPVHRSVLLARCQVFRSVVAGKCFNNEGLIIRYSSDTGSLSIAGCHALSVLILLNYFYSDGVCPVWDRRISVPVAAALSRIGAVPSVVRLDMQRLARALNLPTLRHAVETIGKRTPVPTLNNDFNRLFDSAQAPDQPIVPYDILLELADHSVGCHSVVLRARSPFFAGFFDEKEWTINRWNKEGVICVDLKHLEWKFMSYVIRYMCCGMGDELFHDIDFIKSADELVDFVFGVMYAANELMLEQLSEICSAVIIRHMTLYNCTSILAEASPLYSPKLKTRIHEYIAVNMECLLEKRFLDDVAHDAMKELSAFVRTQQAIKLPYTRSGIWVTRLLEKHKAWLDLQDFPSVLVRTYRQPKSPKASPNVPGSPKTPRRMPSFSLLSKPQKSSPTSTVQLNDKQSQHDGMFSMDEEDSEGITSLGLPSGPQPSVSPVLPPLTSVTPPGSAWKGASTTKPDRIDMRSIMANEAAGSRPTRSPTVRIAGFESGSHPVSPSKAPQKDRAPLSMRQASLTSTPPASASTSWRDYPGLSGSPAQRGTESKATAGDFPNLLDPGSRPRVLSVRSTGSPSTIPNSNTPQPQAGGSSMKLTRPSPVPVASQPTFPGLGPVIVPKRSTSGAEGTKKRHVSDAWTAPPPMPSPPPGSAGSISFSAIQQQQHAQKAESGNKSKLSLLEIQEEEQRRARELQEQELFRARESEELAAEVEFMQWWNSEEARLKKETEVGAGGERKGRKKGRGGGRKSRGRGGGGERASGTVSGNIA